MRVDAYTSGDGNFRRSPPVPGANNRIQRNVPRFSPLPVYWILLLNRENGTPAIFQFEFGLKLRLRHRTSKSARTRLIVRPFDRRSRNGIGIERNAK